jgi:nitrogen fixation/metabolism regulation signal transduction histidine kinase
VLSVPLAPRQREIEREIQDLNRGVLVGAVLVVLLAAGLGAWAARRVSDPVARLSKATRQIAQGRLDITLAADTADELRRLIDDFNRMTATLRAQRAALARTNQLKAWNEMARQVAHEIKNPLTPIQLAAEHLQRVHADQGAPLGAPFDQCVRTVLDQVRLLRQIASEFANFSGDLVARPETVSIAAAVEAVLAPYRLGLSGRVRFDVEMPDDLPDVRVDRTLLSRALTNVVENAIQAMPAGGTLRVTAIKAETSVVTSVTDTGVGMSAEGVERAFQPYFSTKTGGSGLGLPNARRNIELSGGTITLASEPGTGTTVTITLPRADRPGGAGTASPPLQ